MNARYGIIAAGVLGVLAAFLPFIPGDWSSSLWAAHDSRDGVHTYLVLLAFIGAAALGALGVKHGMQRWKAFAAIVCFALPAFEFARGISGDATILQLFGLAIGAKLVALATLAGTVCAIVAATRPDPVVRPSVIT
jgi:hypothetical protein